jgi:phage terminase small subunit
LATRTPRRGAGRKTAAKRRSAAAPARKAKARAGEELDAHAARLGITPQRVLQEYARIAFADLSRVAHWGGEKGVELKAPEDLTEDDTAPISEIVAGTGGSGARVKLYDKKAALDALARHFGLLVPAPQQRDGNEMTVLAEEAREVLARRLARLAAGGAEE